MNGNATPSAPAPESATEVAIETAIGVGAAIGANALAPGVGQAVLILLAKYGPSIVPAVRNLLTKADPTVKDVEDLFSVLLPYEAFGIPDKVPAGSTT